MAQSPAITEIEVNQVLGKQLNGALDFVAGKDTAIRAFLASAATVDPGTTKLVVERNGTVVTELAPKSYDKPVAIVEFLCPTRAACGNWQEGTYKFTATVNGVTLSTTAGTIVFKERQPMRILVRPVKANYKGTIQSVTGDRWRKAVDYVRQVYPVAADKISWVIQDEFDASGPNFDLETETGRDALYDALNNLMPQHCAANKKADGCYELIVGFIQSRPLGFPDGKLQGYTNGPPTSISVASDEDMDATVAHEIAHIYGIGDTYDKDGALRCSVNPAPDNFSGKDWDIRTKTVACKAGRTQFPEGAATLIPAEARAYEVGGRGDLGVKACFMGSGAKQADNWITPDTYKHLFNELAPVATPAKTSRFNQREAVISQKLVHFSGYLNATSDVRVDPWYTLESMEDATDTTGTLLIRAVDANGVVLASQAIAPQFVALSNPPRQMDWAPFDGVIRFSPHTAKFQIVDNGTVKYEVGVNAKDPEVSGVTPAVPGATLQGDQTIQWHATANGPQPLNYLVEYNPNPLHSPLDWIVLGADLTSTVWREDFSTLPGGDRAKLRVTVTDGVRSSTAESREFKVAFKAPEVFIDEVEPTLPAGLDLELDAEVFDLQDDIVADSRLLWRSSLSGVLGSGSHVIARGLPAGRHVITLTATNSVGLTSTGTVTVDVLAAPAALAIATACPLLNPPTAGTAFSQTLIAIGGTGTLTFSLSAGSLPAGLTLSPSGLISGTATAAGTASFTLQVSDSSSPAQTATKSCAMTVNAAAVAPVITAACPLPVGTVGIAYTNVLTATGTAPMAWTLTSGTLPGALTLTSAGTITGVPQHAGTHTFTLTATNSVGTGSKACSLTIQNNHAVPAPTIATSCPLPSATVGTAYMQPFFSTNGVAPLTYSISTGSLPAGLTLSTAGIVAGTPTVAGTAAFTVLVNDATTPNPQMNTKACSLTVNAAASAPTIATACPLPAGTEGAAYSQALTATGGTAPYTFSVLAGALPRPLTLSTNGTLTGTPFHAGVYNFTLQVAGGNGLTSLKSCSLTIGVR